MDPAADAAVLSVQVLEQLVRVLRQLGTAGDLSFPAAATLTRLCTDGPYRLTELALAEGSSQPGMTQLVTRLGRDGLVRRVSTPDDGRVVMVEATDAGRALVEQRRTQRAEALAVLIDRLDACDRDALHDALPALGRLATFALQL